MRRLLLWVCAREAEGVSSTFVWRPDDDALLERLEDEDVLERVFRWHAGHGPDKRRSAAAHTLPRRAAGLVAIARTLPGGVEAVREALAGDATKLGRLIEAAPMIGRPPALLHHVALYFGKVATALERHAPDAAARAWTHALAAWLALADERTYLEQLEEAVLCADAKKGRAADVTIPPERVPLELVAELGRRAEATSRDLAAPGRAALLALAGVHDAARIAGISEAAASSAMRDAERRRNAALEAALAAIGGALDDANVQGALTTEGRTILLRARQVWGWSGQDDAVEHFVVDKIATVGWELYRQRQWDALRHLIEPFRTMIEHLAARVATDSGQVAYAAPCAQMFVFLSDAETHFARKVEHAERAVAICPSHRNGRLVLASLLCDDAQSTLRTMVLFARRSEVERAEASVARAEVLYPQSRELPATRAMLDRVKKGRIVI